MKYICQICGYVYDDAKEKTPFAELPDQISSRKPQRRIPRKRLHRSLKAT